MKDLKPEGPENEEFSESEKNKKPIQVVWSLGGQKLAFAIFMLGMALGWLLRGYF